MQVNGTFTDNAKLNGRTISRSSLGRISLQQGPQYEVAKYWFMWNPSREA